MKELEAAVRSIQKDGLVWGASKLVPVGFGIKKLQINLIIEDDKVSLSDLEEEIAEFEDFVQSTDIVSFVAPTLPTTFTDMDYFRLPCKNYRWFSRVMGHVLFTHFTAFFDFKCSPPDEIHYLAFIPLWKLWLAIEPKD